MPVYLDRKQLPAGLVPYAKPLSRSAGGFRRSPKKYLDIGIVNNMPDGALLATERQFLTLLDSASGGLSIRITFYALPGVPRSESLRNHLDEMYSSITDLWNHTLDGLIVTGTEPKTPQLVDEPYWPSFTQLLEWAERNTGSTVWSCLAAHAAVLYLDGIERRRLPEKRFGLFPCVHHAEHWLTSGLLSPVVIPHSRWNDLPEQELAECGYQILTRSDEAGADSFVKHGKSLFVFFQGHPEYEANSLFLEYRRDVGRYLRGQRETYPQMPLRCFDARAEACLQAMQDKALHQRSEELLSDFPNGSVERALEQVWHSSATRLYGNWLAYLSARKDGRLDAFNHRADSASKRPAVFARRFAAGANRQVEI